MTAVPNLLCISIDSLRADHCSFLTGIQDTTPNLRELSKKPETATFTQAISPSIWTLASHASIFTGLYPEEHQLNDKGEKLGDHPTFGQLFSENGYNTKSFGYNGWLQQGDILRGFNHTTTKQYNKNRNSLKGIGERAWHNLKSKMYRTEGKDKQTIQNTMSDLSSVQPPFCFFIHLQGPHYKYYPHVKYYREFGSMNLYNLVKIRKYQNELYDSKVRRYVGDSPPQRILSEIKDLYRGCIRQTDTRIGEIIRFLEENNLLDNTVLLVFADHGESFGDDGIFGHNFSLSDSLIRVPMVIYDPTNKLKQGRRNDIVQTIDIYPTVLEFSDIDIPETNAQSLIKQDERNYAYIHYDAADSMYSALKEEIQELNSRETKEIPERKMYGIWQSSNNKLIWYPGTDRYDSTGSDKNRLKDELDAHLSNLEIVEQRQSTEVSPTIEDNLKDMGYL